MSDKHHLANRSKTDLSKKVEHNAPSAQRSLKTAASAAERVSGSVGNALTSTVDSLAGSAGNDHGAKSAQMLSSATAAGGRVVSTALRSSVNVVAKVPESIKRARIETRGYKRAQRYARRKMTLRQRIKFRPRTIEHAIGGSLRMGSGLADRAFSGLSKAAGAGDGTGASAMGLAVQSGQAALAGARAIKTGTSAAGRTLKTTRKIATKVTRGITNGVSRGIANRAARASAKAAGEAAKASLQTAKLAAKFMQSLEMAVARLLSLIFSNAPFSLVVIGVIILIILGGGAFMMVAFKD